MTKILKVIKPFFVMEENDTFVYDEETGMYKSTYTVDYDGTSEHSTAVSSYVSTYTISTDYAQALINDGFLTEVAETPKAKNFTNIFDEIDKLLAEYYEDLKALQAAPNTETPQCVRLEHETVTRNLIHLLEHLKSLKK